MTKEEMALDILDRLGKYYTIYYNFISNNTNVRFRILYKSNDGREVVYTNVPSMSLDELRGFGKYLFIPGKQSCNDPGQCGFSSGNMESL